MVIVGYGRQGEEAAGEAVIIVAYFKIICAMGVERSDKGYSALFHITIDITLKLVRS